MMNNTENRHTQEYRAHTPEQKREIIERLYRIWLEKPELRLGQLLTSFGRGLYHVEDFDMLSILEQVYMPVTKDKIV